MKQVIDAINFRPIEDDQIVIDLAKRISSNAQYLGQIVESLVPCAFLIDTVEAYYEASWSIITDMGFTRYGPKSCRDIDLAFHLIRKKIHGELQSLEDDQARAYVRENNLEGFFRRKMTWDEAVDFMTYAEGDPKLQQVLRTYNYQNGSTDAESLISYGQAYKYQWYKGLTRLSESSISACLIFLAEYYRELGPDVRMFSAEEMLASGSIAFELNFYW